MTSSVKKKKKKRGGGEEKWLRGGVEEGSGVGERGRATRERKWIVEESERDEEETEMEPDSRAAGFAAPDI
jgi:hypothetical protein